MQSLNINFGGPFSLLDGSDSVFRATCGWAAGVYLWTVRQKSDNTHLIHYVGETVAMAKRHREHLVHILGLNYGIFDPDNAQGDIADLIWPGLWRDKSKQMAAYEAIHSSVLRYVSVLSVFFAPVDADRELRRHVEGCIGWNLRSRHVRAVMGVSTWTRRTGVVCKRNATIHCTIDGQQRLVAMGEM